MCIGKEVTVYSRYLFAVPVKGCVISVSEKDGAYQVQFYHNNPGGPNVTKHSGKYFLKGQCELTNKSVELKPCPFCGGPAEDVKNYHMHALCTECPPTKDLIHPAIQCVHCGGVMMGTAEQWNNRRIEGVESCQ